MAAKSRKKQVVATTKSKDSVASLRAEIAELQAELDALRTRESNAPKVQKRKHFWRSFGAGTLAVLAVTTFALWNISFWVKDTVVDTNQFVSTMQPLIKDPEIQKALQTEITNQVFSQIRTYSSSRVRLRVKSRVLRAQR
jgi:hypothetical protein